jgi:thiamine-phosphate pyrophosphorylase
MRGLYPIIDVDALRARSLAPLEFARRVIGAGPELVQLRAKHASARETLELLRALRPLCRAAGVGLFANDRPDLAVLAECDGVHVGQADLGVHDVRRFAPGLRVGVSTHNGEQLRAALRARPDYVAFGPVFETQSKQQPDPVVGLCGLAAAAHQAHRAACPLVAIGGINLERAPSVAALGAVGAVIGALLPPTGSLDQVGELARALHAALGGAARSG